MRNFIDGGFINPNRGLGNFIDRGFINPTLRLCKVTKGLVSMPRWDVLVALNVCFEMSIVESLAIAVMPGMSMPHLASAYPRGLISSSVGDNVITIADTPYYDPVVSCTILG